MRLMLIVAGLLSAVLTKVNAQAIVDKTASQAGMQQHVERHIVDEAMPNVGPATGGVKPLDRLLERSEVKRLP